MSTRDLDRAIQSEAAGILNNPKLRQKDCQEWSTGEIVARDDDAGPRSASRLRAARCRSAGA